MPPVQTESAPGKMPGVSVSDAFGLPDDWSLENSLKGVSGEGEKRDLTTPADDADDTTETESKTDPVETDKGETETPAEDATEQTGVDADKKEAEAAATKKRETDAAAAAKKTADAKAAKTDKKTPADKTPAAPKVEKPATPAKDAAAKVPPLTPAKIKVGDKEYTEDELKAALTPKTAPKEPAKVEATQTPEQLKASQTEQKQKDDTWIASTAKTLDVPMDEKTLDAILSGGPEAVTAFKQHQTHVVATTLLQARRDIFKQLEPVLNAVETMQKAHETQENERQWTSLVTDHPHLNDYRELVEQHAAAMAETHPELARAMSQKDFNDKCAELTTNYIKKFNPTFGAPPPEVVVPPAGTPTAPKAPAAAAPVKRKTPAPPAGNVPGGAPAAGGKGGNDFQKSAVASLM